MKLNDVKPGFEGSAGAPEQFFSIKDTGMIFDILRNKMYSNPILAIAREISSNARDAHREVGKADEPIVIVLPNNLESNYRIKDFGPGISPDRMSNIFIQYTASTKRDDNIQTGGFGLGAKTPFSYSDTFTIITVHNGTKYQYAAYIDPTRVGKLRLMSDSPTTEPNSTEIIIPVEPKDHRHFAEWTEHACRHWTVKPIIKGGTLVWKPPAFILEGKGWGIAAETDYDRQAKLVIDGIEYPLGLDVLRTYASTQLIDVCRGSVIMYFDVGELTLSASREQVYLDKRTQDKITLRLKSMRDDIKKLIDAKIDAFPDLWQANLYYHKGLTNAFSDLRFLGKLAWKGIELHNGWVNAECPAFTFSRGKYSRKHGTDPNKLSRSRMNSIQFAEGSQIFINDLPIKNPTPRHVKKAFEDDPKLQSIQLLCPTDVITEEKLNKGIHLDKMAPKRLSDITKASGRSYTPASQRLLVFKFDPIYAQYRQVSYASIDEDTNDKVLCRLQKEDYPVNTRIPIIKDSSKQTINLNSMKSVAERSPKVSFYGVDSELPTERVEEEFGDFQALEEFVDEKILNNKSINYVEIKFAIEQNYHVDENVLRNLAQLQKLIQDPNSLFLKRAALHQKIKDINTGDTGLLHVYESVKGTISKKDTADFLKNNPEWDFPKMNSEYQKSYPLLESVNHYHYGNIVEHVAHYINLIDVWNKDQTKKTN
jgi:hypothetical protein